MVRTAGRTHSSYRHSVLIHDTDEELISGTRDFVARGLASDGEVLVLGPRDRMGMMREALGSHPRLEYGLEEELYQAPMRTLFGYQRKLAGRPESTEVWVTGTVPLGHGPAEQAAWNRYESAVDVALSAYPFVGMCTYDTRARPAPVIEAALATHRTVNANRAGRESPDYVEPAAFLADARALVPRPPAAAPVAATTITDLNDLRFVRSLLKSHGHHRSAVSEPTIGQFLVAVHEVAANGLVHGSAPVQVTLWADVASLTCLVEDSGPGHLDPMTSYRYPHEREHFGVWAARQMVDDLVIGQSASGGCSVLVTVTER
jgi:anti-sigma regulatory factor (Ser/Thr protein kinase)